MSLEGEIHKSVIMDSKGYSGLPDISVIVPIYNSEKYLDRCITSLTNQTLRNIEIVLIDDGSLDGSYSICQHYERSDNRVKLFHTENHGQGAARNLGIQYSTGEIIAFLDSDDYYDINACEEIVKTMRTTGVDMLSFGYQIEDNSQFVLRVPPMKSGIYTENSFYRDYVVHFLGDLPEDDTMVGIASTMTAFKRGIIEKNGISFRTEKEYISEDAFFCLDYSKYANKAATVKKVLYHYCQNYNSTSHVFDEDRFARIAVFTEKLREYNDSRFDDREANCRISYSGWVNYLSQLKVIVRFFPLTVAYSKVRENVIRISDNMLLEGIQEVKLPFKQQVLASAIAKRRVLVVFVMIKIRNLRKYL